MKFLVLLAMSVAVSANLWDILFGDTDLSLGCDTMRSNHGCSSSSSETVDLGYTASSIDCRTKCTSQTAMGCCRAYKNNEAPNFSCQYLVGSSSVPKTTQPRFTYESADCGNFASSPTCATLAADHGCTSPTGSSQHLGFFSTPEACRQECQASTPTTGGCCRATKHRQFGTSYACEYMPGASTKQESSVNLRHSHFHAGSCTLGNPEPAPLVTGGLTCQDPVEMLTCDSGTSSVGLGPKPSRSACISECEKQSSAGCCRSSKHPDATSYSCDYVVGAGTKIAMAAHIQFGFAASTCS